MPMTNDTDTPGRLDASGPPTIEQSDGLKIVAVLCMTIDHVGAILLPNVAWLRIIGRVAFPLFAYQLAIGYVHTSDLRRYALRLGIWGLIAQPVYMLAFGVRLWELNIFATLLLGLLAMWGFPERPASACHISWSPAHPCRGPALAGTDLCSAQHSPHPRPSQGTPPPCPGILLCVLPGPPCRSSPGALPVDPLKSLSGSKAALY
jgi:hypothetical protein